MKEKMFTIGIDYGTDSVRAILVNTSDGSILGSSIQEYKRWNKKLWCDAKNKKYRQHPDDYIEGLEIVLKDIVRQCPDSNLIKSIAIDATSSTPCIIDKHCSPLCLYNKYANNPDAMFFLWKDHTATKEAEIITQACIANKVNYAIHSGGTYLPEFFWTKIIHALNSSPELIADAYTAIELCDWISNTLTGCKETSQMVLNSCSASVKMMWDNSWGGFPPEDFLGKICPNIIPILQNMPRNIKPTWQPIGTLSKEWAEKTGLNENIIIGAGNVDSYAGAIGAGINDGKLILNIGTSSCYMAVMPIERSTKSDYNDLNITGVFGQAKDSILPNRYGYETGLSAFGDLFRWFENLLLWPTKLINNKVNSTEIERELRENILNQLTIEAQNLEINLDTLYATDNFNGRRCPNPNSNIKAAIEGLTLSTSPAEIFYALAEAAVFATRRIANYMEENGVAINKFICIGGITLKSPFIMQLLADATNHEIFVPNSSQGCALGAAITASVAGGIHQTITEAQNAMTTKNGVIYSPDRTKYNILSARYKRYLQIIKNIEDIDN